MCQYSLFPMQFTLHKRRFRLLKSQSRASFLHSWPSKQNNLKHSRLTLSNASRMPSRRRAIILSLGREELCPTIPPMIQDLHLIGFFRTEQPTRPLMHHYHRIDSSQARPPTFLRLSATFRLLDMAIINPKLINPKPQLGPSFTEFCSMTPNDAPSLPRPRAKRQWSLEEDALIVKLRRKNMIWEDIAKEFPGRSAIACLLHYQNYLEKSIDWHEDRNDHLARAYHM
jgi:hypothetical protein